MTARDEGHAGSPAEPDHRLHFGGALRQHDGGGRGSKMDERIRLVGQQIDGVLKKTAGSDNVGEIAQKMRVHGLER